MESSTTRPPGLRCRKLLLWVIGMTLPAIAPGQPVPEWISSTHRLAPGGTFILQWSIQGDETVSAFRVEETSALENRVFFTDQAEIRLFRTLPGDYHYRVQSCTDRFIDMPKCGKPSAGFTLKVVNGPAPD